MKRLLTCICLVALVSACGPSTENNVSPTASSLQSTATTAPPSETPTLPPTETATPTPLPCDPLNGYCVEDGHFLLERPIAQPGTIAIDRGYPYGSTEEGTRELHHGVEFYNASGTPVLAAADGVVVVAGSDEGILYGPQLNFYGKLIVLEHHFPGIDQSVFTLYGHLSKIDVQTGQVVYSGDKIGEVGATGFAIGSHLHFEVRLGRNDYNSTRNPVLWLKPLTGEDGDPLGVIAGRLVDMQGNLIQATGLNVQFFPDPNGTQAAAYQVETYTLDQYPINGDDGWRENFTLNDLPAGNYRLSLVWGGRVYDHWIVVAPGKVTFLVFQIDQ